MNRLFSVPALLGLALTAGAQSVPESQAANVDQVVDRAVRQENTLMAALRTEHPLAETYIQEMRKDTEFGKVPRTDHYFLGKVDLSHGVNTNSYIPKPGTMTSSLKFF